MSSILVEYNSNTQTLQAEPGQLLLDVLRQNGLSVSAPCGGNGTCGKCRVTLVTDQNSTQILACQTRVENDCRIRLKLSSNGVICTHTQTNLSFTPLLRNGFGAAIDLGTTTIAIRLFDLSTANQVAQISDWNIQRSYGGDVITRCQYCMEHDNGLEVLSHLIRQQILQLLTQMCAEKNIPFRNITEICLSGNTVMQHLVTQNSPISIALAPFTPKLFFDRPFTDHLGNADVFYSPCVSGYVGGDITAGLLACGLDQKEEISLFLDIGTNGEMALYSHGRFVCCAVASGPAFEGAGITCGMSSTQGAVCHVQWTPNGPEYEVIGGGTPKGLCGSGLLDLLAVLLKLGAVDESGYLLPPEDAPSFFSQWLGEDEDGNGIFYLTSDKSIFFTARDVRQLQLAKAAVAAGISVLMEHTGLSFSDLNTLYLAGGFGCHMSAQSAVAIGMLPEALQAKIRCVGNSSLSGTSTVLLDPAKRKNLLDIQKKCQYLELSGNTSFNYYFPEHMTFDKEESPWK